MPSRSSSISASGSSEQALMAMIQRLENQAASREEEHRQAMRDILEQQKRQFEQQQNMYRQSIHASSHPRAGNAQLAYPQAHPSEHLPRHQQPRHDSRVPPPRPPRTPRNSQETRPVKHLATRVRQYHDGPTILGGPQPRASQPREGTPGQPPILSSMASQQESPTQVICLPSLCFC